MPLVGQDIPHESAAAHVTGRSQFIDDIPPVRGELHVEVFGSPEAHGTVRRLRLDPARQSHGVQAILTARDIPGQNHLGPIIRDEHLLADEVVEFVGDPLVLIAAESKMAAVQARGRIEVEIDALPCILTVADALAADSFLGPPRTIERGNLLAAFDSARHHLQGTLRLGGQEHFYFESQAAIAYPEEQQSFTIWSSTQHPSEVQAVVAEVLGIPFHRVHVYCRRMGGGFGGKETQAAQPAAMAALVAWHTGRPARLVLGRDDDMAVTGKRHPCQATYHVAFDDSGHILALDLELVADGGCSTDLSPSVLERAMLHVDNAYYLPAVRITGRVCKTHFPSNTAFRGFGGPQGVACIESILEDIAKFLRHDAYDVRQRNCYGGPGRDVTPYGQKLRNNVLPRLLAQLRKTSDYDRRRRDIEAFHAGARTELRGLAMTSVKFGISFTRRTLNQANALVNLYTDGSVLVSTGATEMGQGVHTRIRQLVADDLGLPFEAVHVGVTSTEKNNNTSATAASCSTDLNGAAALDATRRIRRRLAKFVAPLLADPDRGLLPSPPDVRLACGMVFDERAPDRRMPFSELVQRAYEERVSLGERGFYATPGVDFNREAGQGQPFRYFTQGAAVSEVWIDRFTGETRILRADLLMDIGMPINPGIDRGQITGGFLQGLGWVTTESLAYDGRGALLSHSPTTYKIPNVGDLPEDFRVSLFHNPGSNVSLHRSKAVGEPPLLLGISVWAAIKNALGYAAEPRPLVPLSIPATPEHVLLTLTELSPSRTTVS